MIGQHGTSGACSVGAAVLTDPVRRVLVLGGLLLTALAAVWLAATPAQADERPTPGTEVLTGIGEDLQQEVALDADELQEPLAGTVTGTGEHLARAVVEETSGHLPTDIGASEAPGLGEATQRVHDDVYTVVENLPEDQGGSPVREDEDTAGEEATQDGNEKAPRTREAAPSEASSPVEEAVSVPERAPAEAVAEPGGESSEADDAPPVTGSGSGGSALPSPTPTPTSPTAPAHGVAPGYLSAPGAPAPAPGELQAARHVLSSVPAAPADEATFSPD